MPYKVFVLMPSGNQTEYSGETEEANYVYLNIIVPAVKEALGEDVEISREIDKSKPGMITKSIVENLASADFVIADLTGQNPNVFLELGMRYALRNRVTIVLAQEGTSIPFDMRGYRLIFYRPFQLTETQTEITGSILSSLEEKRPRSDSIVFDTFRRLSVRIGDLVHSEGDELTGGGRIMDWDEYMSKIGRIGEWLSPAVREGHYIPDVVLGISNGGMIVADLLGKSVFSNSATPILGLWAQRHTQGAKYFSNSFNDALMECIKKTHSGDTPIRALLVDDHCASANTANQATSYLLSKLGDDSRILFIPLVSRRPINLDAIAKWLPYDYREGTELWFKISKEEFLSDLDTTANYFPYLNKEVSTGLEDISIETTDPSPMKDLRQ